MINFLKEFHIKYYMNTADGTGNNLPPIGFVKIGFLVLFSFVVFPFVKDYTTLEVLFSLFLIHVLSALSVLGLNKKFPSWFNKTWKEVLVGVFLPLYTLSFLAGFKP